MSNAIFGKAMENVRKNRDIKLVTTEKTIWCQNQIISFFTENFLALEMKKQKKPDLLTNKPVRLRISILELSKILMYEFWYDYVKPEYSGRAKL